MTGLPAGILRLPDRGRIATGAVADWRSSIPRRSPIGRPIREPTLLPAGVEAVVVRGHARHGAGRARGHPSGPRPHAAAPPRRLVRLDTARVVGPDRAARADLESTRVTRGSRRSGRYVVDVAADGDCAGRP